MSSNASSPPFFGCLKSVEFWWRLCEGMDEVWKSGVGLVKDFMVSWRTKVFPLSLQQKFGLLS